MKRRRDWGAIVFLLLLLLVFGFLGWLTRNPAAEIVRRAEGWPGVGPYATSFREAYQSPPEPLPTAYNRQIKVVYKPPSRDYVWVQVDEPLLREPQEGARELLRTESLANLTLLERQGDWARVWSNQHQVEGWVRLSEDDGDGPPLGMEPDPPGPLWPRAPSPQDLKQAFTLLKGEPKTLELGPYTLHTDVEDPVLFQRLGSLAEQLDRAYADRYGREPLGKPAEHVVLYASEGAYRVQQHRSYRLHGLDAGGHTSRGAVFFFRGKRRASDLHATLIHEIGHLLNRRALGPALPPWLDEGIADDFSHGRIDADGNLRPELLGGVRLSWTGHQSYEGGWASLLNLESAAKRGRLPKLERLLGYDWQDFVGSKGRLHYDTAAFFVRFLLSEGGEEAFPEAFRAFLDDVAAGKTLEPELLRARLGRPWDELDRIFERWILDEARALRRRG